MGYLEIKLEGDKSVLVDESAEICKESYFLYNKNNDSRNCNWIVLCCSTVEEVKGVGTYYNGLHHIWCIRITHSINHSISLDVPMVVIEDEVEKLVQHKWELHKDLFSDNSKESFISIFKTGYKASQQKGVYSEEDLCNLVQQLKNYTKESLSILGHDEREPEEFVDIFLKSNQEYIELETEVIFCHGNGMLDYAIKTDRINGQLIAFNKKQLTIQND